MTKSVENIAVYRTTKNKIFKAMIVVLSIITISPIVLIITKLVIKGISQINISFFTEKAPDTFEAMMAANNGEIIPGGILNGIAGTFYMVLIAIIMAVPLGIMIGVFLYENGGKRYAGFIRDITDILQSVPSIILGLISYLWIVKNITHGYSALAGGAALAIMMLPLIIRSTEETFKMLPNTIKEAGFALGVPYHRVIIKLLIPTGFSGLMTGILLAISRVIGETAPLILTALGSPVVNFYLDKPTSAVSLLIWEFYNNANMVELIWSSSLFLMGFVLLLNILSKRIAARRK